MANYSRRDVFNAVAGSAAVAGLTLAGLPALADVAPRRLGFHNLHTGESLETVYFDRGVYVPEALEAVNHVLRDFRTGEVHRIDPRLLDLLVSLSERIESRNAFQVISGYRSPATNAMLRSHSDGVASSSLHMQGLAIDIRVADIALDHLHAAALDLGGGGVGYYPASDFVHVDVGRVRHWGAA